MNLQVVKACAMLNGRLRAIPSDLHVLNLITTYRYGDGDDEAKDEMKMTMIT